MGQQIKAFSYVRFSTPEQVAGDSLRRQVDLAIAWSKRNNVPLDTELRMRDEGASAFRGTHRTDPTKHALAAFLAAVESGEVPRGSYLLIENPDRLSREKPLLALTLLLSLLANGVRVVQLSPCEIVYDEDATEMQLMSWIFESARGHGESKIKSVRLSGAWQAKRAKAADGEPVRHRLPAWITRQSDGTFALIPERAAAIRRAVELAGLGHGGRSIIRILNSEGVPAFTRTETRPGRKRPALSGRWSPAYVRKLLTDRRILGEMQFSTADGTPAGPAITEYFPRVVSDLAFSQAALALGQQKRFKGRQRKRVNVFARTLFDAISGTPLTMYSHRSALHLVPLAAVHGHAPHERFPYEVMEEAILRTVREIDAADVIGKPDAVDAVRELETQAEAVRAELNMLQAQLAVSVSPSLMAAATQRETRLADLAGRLADAKRDRLHPAAQAWEEARTLAHTLAQADDKDAVRMAVRTHLRRVGMTGHAVIVTRDRMKIAAVQVRTEKPEMVRNFRVIYKSGCRMRAAVAWVSHATAEAGGVDLRVRADADALRQELLAVDLAELQSELDATPGRVIRQ